MIDGVKVYKDGGIVVESKGRKILIDPCSIPGIKPSAIFVSHAHRDHYSLKVLKTLRGVPKIMSQATRELIDPHGTLDNVIIVNGGLVAELEGLTLEFHEAGHIIGSLQLRIDTGLRIVYTGDFCLEKRIVLRPAPVLKADVLIIDATYGHPNYSLPPRGTLDKKLLEITKERVELGENLSIAARVLGTGLEVTAILSFLDKLT
ncbi:MAG: MBL fold metallo-hydrolase, partial [Thermofilaceae archaeon]